MRSLAVSTFAAIALWVAPTRADPVLFQPEGCDFALTFPSPPTITQTKATTSRGDSVITNRAELHPQEGGKAGILRAECSRIPHMGSMDEAILTENMRALGDAYKLQSASVAILHNAVAGTVGRLHAKARSGGKDITLEITRYTSANNIFDVWVGAEPEVFPTEADNAFLKSLKLNGAQVP